MSRLLGSSSGAPTSVPMRKKRGSDKKDGIVPAHIKSSQKVSKCARSTGLFDVFVLNGNCKKIREIVERKTGLVVRVHETL